MNKKITLMQLFVIMLGLWNGYSFSMQRGAAGVGAHTVTRLPQASVQQRHQVPTYQVPPLQPVYHSVRTQPVRPGGYNMPTPQASQFEKTSEFQLSAPAMTQKTKRQQPKRESQAGTYEETTTKEEDMPVAPTILKHIAENTIALWNIYEKAKRTPQDQFYPQDWNKMVERIDTMQNSITQVNNDQLNSAFESFSTILNGADFFDKTIFGEAINNILAAINDITEYNPTGPYRQHFDLRDVPYVLALEEPSLLYSATGTITQPFSSAWDWTKGAASSVWGYGKSAVSSLSSGASAVRQWAAPTQEEVDKAHIELKKIKKEITRLQTQKTRTQDGQVKLTKLISLKGQYEAKIAGWTPWLIRGAVLGGAALAAKHYYK